jgi:L-ascorbate metabolism protein UlaG (beta-lactamase superfamily)
MKIKWLGQASFLIKAKRTLVTDPFNPMVGKLPADLKAEVVTVSHAHMDHNYTKGVGGNPQIVNQTGSFTVDDFKINGVTTFHDNEGGKFRGVNIVYTIEAEGLSLCHLGDLGHTLTENQLKEIGPVDVLMIPVGGFFTIDAAMAVQVVGQLKPKIVLPMHYKVKGSLASFPLAGVDKFTEILAWPVEELLELEIDVKIKDQPQRVIIIKRLNTP